MATAWIVLGIQLRADGTARDMLRCRTWYAGELFRKYETRHNQDIIIVTGGACGRPKPPRSEAEAMKELLVEQGVVVDSARILLEPNATSCKTNATRSLELMHERRSVMGEEFFTRVVVIGTDYQIKRKGITKIFVTVFKDFEVHFVGSPFKSLCQDVKNLGTSDNFRISEKIEFPESLDKLKKYVADHGLPVPWENYKSTKADININSKKAIYTSLSSSRGKAKACFTCGKVGHLAWNCPNSKKSKRKKGN